MEVKDYKKDYLPDEFTDEKSGRFIVHQPITTIDELEFAIFCIEEVAKKKNLSGKEVYDKVTKVLPDTSTILDSYLTPSSEILSTQGERYIISDVISVMKEWGIDI